MAENRIQIKALTPSTWQVMIHLPKQEVSDEQLVEMFRTVKTKIAGDFNLPLNLLHYKDIVRKELNSSLSRISLIMERFDLPQGDPVVRLKSIKADDGIEYKNMILELDLYPLTKAGTVPQYAEIEALIKEAGVSFEFINVKVIERSLQKLESASKPMKNIVIGRGKLPGSSEDGRLEYCCQIKSLGSKGYIGVEKVESGRLLCKKIPAVKSRKTGRNLFGKNLASRNPQDYFFTAGDGAKLSNDGTEIYACRSGLFRVKDTTSEPFPLITGLTFSLENLSEIDGSKPVNLILEKPVEINGGLKSGSNVISDYEVIINGDVESGANIQTASNIVINGDIIGAEITGTDSINADNVNRSRLVAEGKLIIKGTAASSHLSGKEVFIHKLIECTVVASDKLVLQEVLFNEGNSISKLKVGLQNQLRDVAAGNRKFLEFAENNLKNLSKVFGEQIIAEAETSNLPQMLLKHLKNLRLSGSETITLEKRQALTDLLQVIPTLKNLSAEKRNSIRAAEIRMNETEIEAEIFFKKALEGNIVIDFNGKTKILDKLTEATKIKLINHKTIKSQITEAEMEVFNFV